MRWSLTVAAVLMLVGIAGAAEPPEPLPVRLQLRSDARVPGDVLEEARDEVVRIFAQSGFEVAWTDTAPDVTVRIAAQVLGYARATSQVMGAAQRTANGPVAHVFLRQVQDLARTYHVDLGTLLGHVIAHEVGHLLLPTFAHSPTGLMRAEWDDTQVRDAARRALSFTDGQAYRIRAVRGVFR
jgi:hypothetical protein